MADKFEYIKWYLEYTNDETPVIFFYEVDLENERYATRMTEVFKNGNAVPVDDGFEFVTDEPIPVVNEINQEKEFYAIVITKEEFESVYNCTVYTGNTDFPA